MLNDYIHSAFRQMINVLHTCFGLDAYAMCMYKYVYIRIR